MRGIRWLALHVSERMARALLYPITAYFLAIRGVERRSSRRYLRRVLGRKPRFREVARHFYTFAVTILDRVFLLTDRFAPERVRVHGLPALLELVDAGRGVLLLGSHLGSFEAVRAIGMSRPDVTVRVVMDYGHNPQLTALLDALNPRVRATLIDAAENSTTVLLKVHETIEAGGLVGILADRPHLSEPTVTCNLLGGPVKLPLSPFRIAAVLKAPVMLMFGLVETAGSYEVYFEKFADPITISRSDREGDIRNWAQRYADRLEARARSAPYNWFNFYDYWNDL